MTTFHRTFAAAAGILLMTSTPAWAQTWIQAGTQIPPRVTKTIALSGPRFGLTVLSPGNVEALKERDITVRPLISQFGWQFEKQIYANPDGVTLLTEWVPLLSGLDQGVALPSLNWLVGARTPIGTEFGLGPNLSPAGVGLVLAGGVTIRSGAIHVPLTFAVTLSKSGSRVTILTGFSWRH